MGQPIPPGTVIKAAVSGATSGNNTLVAAVAGKRIRVHSLALTAAATVTVQLRTGASGTNLTGAMTLVAGTPQVLPHNERGWCDTDTANQLLNMALGGAVQVSGVICYSLIS